MKRHFPKLVGFFMVGILGGGLGAFALSVFLPSQTAPAQFTPTAYRAEPLEWRTKEALGSVVPLLKPKPRAQFGSLNDLEGTALSLTADGLLATPARIKNAVGLVGTSSSGVPFPLGLARTKTNQVMTAPEFGLTFLRSTAAEASQLTPVTFAAWEDLELGETLLAIDSRRRLSWHRIVALYPRFRAEEPIASEDLASAIFQVDGEPEAGAFLFKSDGRLAGLARPGGAVLPAEFIAHLLRQYLKDGQYRPVMFGVNFLEAAHLIALKPDSPVTGLVLTSSRAHPAVSSKSPAASAGLRAGDVLTALDGRQLNGAIPFQILLQRYASGTEVGVVFMRNGHEESVKVTLGAK